MLFDSDLHEQELEFCGYTKSELNQPTMPAMGGEISFSELQARAAGGSAARLGLFTSGATGLPKLVWQPAANLARAVKVSPRHAEATWALAYSPTHVAGIQVYLQALANGCPMVDVHGLARAEVLTAIERHGLTHISATPSFYRLLLPAEQPMTGVRSVTLGGERADALLIKRLHELFPSARFHNVYASTEAGTLLIADGDLFSIPPELSNRVTVRESRLMVHRSLLGGFSSADPAGEWFDTGDMVEVAGEAPLRFRIVARELDWVNVGGSKVNPHEVEAALAEYPGVRQVRVSARTNSVTGHILCAEVVCAGPPPTEPELREFAASRLQPFKVPRLIQFVDSIVLTRAGKMARGARS
jgi:acyl-coenzyme A synthetase/AMP-(fatty) acid ligase